MLLLQLGLRRTVPKGYSGTPSERSEWVEPKLLMKLSSVEVGSVGSVGSLETCRGQTVFTPRMCPDVKMQLKAKQNSLPEYYRGC